MQPEEDLISTDLIVNTASCNYLNEIALWGKFISILGFLYSLIIALGGVAAGIKIAKLNSSAGSSNTNGVIKAGAAGGIYLLGGLTIFFMSLYLFRFSKSMLTAVANNDQQQLAISFRNLKLYFRFSGILTIILLVFTFFAIIGIILAVSK